MRALALNYAAAHEVHDDCNERLRSTPSLSELNYAARDDCNGVVDCRASAHNDDNMRVAIIDVAAELRAAARDDCNLLLLIGNLDKESMLNRQSPS